MKEYKGKLIGKGFKIGIIVSRFNNFVTARLLAGAVDTLERQGVEKDDIEVAWVPGAFELPLGVKLLIEKDKPDGVICLSALIRGETPHFDFLSAQITKALSGLSLEMNYPLAFGVITADSAEQAMARAGLKEGNKGVDAALSLLEMINLKRELGQA